MIPCSSEVAPQDLAPAAPFAFIPSLSDAMSHPPSFAAPPPRHAPGGPQLSGAWVAARRGLVSLGRLGLLVALCFSTLTACKEEDKAAEDKGQQVYRIQTEVSKTEQLANEIITSAVLEASTWQSLYFGMGGEVKRVLITENQEVQRGKVLATLDSDDQEVNVAKAELNLESSRINEAQAAHKLEQAVALLETGGSSPEDVYDRQQRLLDAETQVKQAELNLESQKLKLADLRLVAPFSGVVNEVNIRVGDLVHGDVADPDRDMNRRPPMVMVDPGSGVVVKAQVPEGRASAIVKGVKVKAQLMEHRSVTLDGEVTWVASTVDRETRTVHVKVSVKEPEGGFPPSVRDGATVLLTFLTDVRANAVTVSEQALFYFQNQVYVFRVNQDKTVTRLPIEKGVMRGGRVEVISGLPTGVPVAASHLYLLRDGHTVDVAAEGE